VQNIQVPRTSSNWHRPLVWATLAETSSDDPKRSRRARKVLIDAIDRFSLKELGIEG
jgi:hypothetical protein